MTRNISRKGTEWRTASSPICHRIYIRNSSRPCQDQIHL